jgi:hypothetical protein
MEEIVAAQKKACVSSAFASVTASKRSWDSVDTAGTRSWSVIGQHIARILETYSTEDAEAVQKYITRFRARICADCEYHGEPDCLCPLMQLPSTSMRTQCEDGMLSTWPVDEMPETD